MEGMRELFYNHFIPSISAVKIYPIRASFEAIGIKSS